MMLGGTIGVTALLLLQAADDHDTPYSHRRCFQCRYFDKDFNVCFKMNEYDASTGMYAPLGVDRLEFCSKFESR